MAATTTYNLAMITGNYVSSGAAYNGGLENYPRFHENWSGGALDRRALRRAILLNEVLGPPVGLRGWTSGLAVPHFVIDAPGGGGKIPLIPEYVESISDDEVVLRNYKGDRFVWSQPAVPAMAAVGARDPEYDFLGLLDGKASGPTPSNQRSNGRGNRKTPKRGRP